MVKIAFVCLGNICRSPMAEGLMKKKVKDLGLERHFCIESRGTSSWEEGNPPHPKTIDILIRVGAILINKQAQKISKEDVANFDYLIAMDHDNIRELKQIFPEYSNKILLFRSINNHGKDLDVKDPYYSGKYEEVYEILDHDLDLWIEKFKHDLNI